MDGADLIPLGCQIRPCTPPSDRPFNYVQASDVQPYFTLAETYSADEAFATGTLGGITPVTRIDGRPIGTGAPGSITARIADWYRDAIAAES